MTTYTNPKNSPPVNFSGRIVFTQQELAAACRTWGPKLILPPGLDGTRVLWAFAGRESSFGADCRPRHEAAYCTGRYASAPSLVAATSKFGHAAHSSFGPWQLLFANASWPGSPDFFGDLNFAAAHTVRFFNEEIFGRQEAQTVEQAADAYNSGNFRDHTIPNDYIAGVLHNYSAVLIPSKL